MHLPPEILDQIYRDLPLNDILTCQYVCHSWHTPAKRKFYDYIEFKTSISTSLFNYCMSQSRLPTLPAPGQFVRQVFFNERNQTHGGLVSLTLTHQHIHTMAKFCPNIQVIECSSFLNDLVLEALLKMSIPLPRLERIPTQGYWYAECALKYSHSLDKLYMAAADFPYLNSFTNLSSLEIKVNTLFNVVEILNMKPQLVELRATIRDRADPSLQRFIQHPLLFLEALRLDFVDDTYPHIPTIQDIIHHMHHLKEFVLTANDIDNGLKALIKDTYRVDNAEIIVYGKDYTKTSDIALEYIDAVFHQPVEGHWYTSLMITNNNVRGHESLQYEISRANHERTISMLLPDIESEDRELHAQYIDRFAQDVNDLIINYNGTPLNQNGCNYFLETVIETCQRLASLTLICGNYSDWGCITQNPTVYRISLIASFLSPTFFHTLSRACPCLKRLEIYKCHVSMMNDTMHYYMPDTSLEEIEFNLDQFKLGHFYSTSGMILKVILKSRQKTLYYYTNYKDAYMNEWTQEQGESEWRNYESLSVIMEFNDIQKIRATYFGIPGIEIDLRLKK